MLFRKRERFERTDVPRESPYTNVIGAVVLVVVFVAVALVVSNVATRVGKETRLGDYDLSSAVRKQSSMQVTDENYSISTASWTKILFLTVDKADSADKGCSLTGARALMIREYTETADDGSENYSITAKLVNLPLDVMVTSSNKQVGLTDLCASKGAAACVVPLSTATNIKFSHVVISTDDGYNKLAEFAQADPTTLVSKAAEVLATMRTDMTADEIVALAQKAATVPADQVETLDAPTMAETSTAADGSTVETGNTVIDKTSLCVQVGTLV